MFRPFLIRPSSGWIQLSEEPYKTIYSSVSRDTDEYIILFYMVPLTVVSNLMMA
jgi:hypothetical protein